MDRPYKEKEKKEKKMYYSDDQEVVRTIGEIKVIKNVSYWTGYFSGIITTVCIAGMLILIGLYFDI